MCVICEKGEFVKCGIIHDPKTGFDLDLKRCTYCGHKQAFEQEKKDGKITEDKLSVVSKDA